MKGRTSDRKRTEKAVNLALQAPRLTVASSSSTHSHYSSSKQPRGVVMEEIKIREGACQGSLQ
jgi:hypothetical protein